MRLPVTRCFRIGLCILAASSFSWSRHPVTPASSAQSTSVVILADGSLGEQQRTVDAMIQTFAAELGRAVVLRVARFDVEPPEPPADAGASLSLPPRTAMRDALSGVLLNFPPPLTPARAVILIVSEESYGSAISRGALVDYARKLEAPIYTILATQPKGQPERSYIESFARAVSSAALWVIEALIEEESRPSKQATSRLLHDLAEMTGGHSYSATDHQFAISCVRAVAEEIRALP